MRLTLPQVKTTWKIHNTTIPWISNITDMDDRFISFRNFSGESNYFLISHVYRWMSRGLVKV